MKLRDVRAEVGKKKIIGSLSPTPVPEDNHNWPAFLQIAFVERPEVNGATEIMILRQ